MRKIKAVDITSIDYKKYGELYNLNNTGENTGNTNTSIADDYIDVDTNKSLLDTLGSLGHTLGSSAPCIIKEMEKHSHTKEALFCTSHPITFFLCEKGDLDPDKIKAVILREGYVFVLDKDIWHSAAHGINNKSYYYWMANVYEGEPTIWKSINPEPILLDI